MILLTSLKNDTNELTYKTETDSDLWLPGRKGELAGRTDLGVYD